SVTLPDGTHAPAQVAPAGLNEKEKGDRLVFVLPALKAGATVTVVPTTLNYVKAPPHFTFRDEPGKVNLLFDGRPVLQYFSPKRDAADHYYTFKPFHHVFDPTGKVLLTNGSAKTAKDGTFPHHRGLFYAWNKISYGDKKAADIWHGTNNVFAQHDKMLSTAAGEVFGRHRSAVSWHGPDGATFATEERELTAYATKGGTLIDFASVLSTELPSVKLDGDPQHAGFHFRANMDVATKTAKETYYLRPDGKGKNDETRNWEPKKPDPKTINLPWDACSFVLGGKRYTVLRVGHPDNPGEARGSERNYGRFGDYFEYTVTPQTPLRVKYRIWAQEGEMTVPEATAIAAAFRTPLAVK
ncbi:PmoA family protein, partial [bacterium]|nr:PmoA family protein [bacterium]